MSIFFIGRVGPQNNEFADPTLPNAANPPFSACMLNSCIATDIFHEPRMTTVCI